MKRRLFAFLLCLVLCVSLTIPFIGKSYAVGLDAYMISAITYALMDSWGITFTATQATASGMENFMVNEVNNYVMDNGGSLVELFGSEVARITAGKLVVGQTLYNGIVNLLNSMRTKYTLDSIDNPICQGQFNDLIIPGGIISGDYIGYLADVTFSVPKGNAYNRVDWTTISGSSAYGVGWGSYGYSGRYYFGLYGSEIRLYMQFVDVNSGAPQGSNDGYGSGSVLGYVSDLGNKLDWNGSDFITPTVLNPDKEWTGTIGGQDIPDTNLDDLMEDIFEDVADNNLDWEGEVIDVPDPPGPVPTWTPVDDVIDGINQGGEILDGIGNDIGDISGHLDDIGDQIGDVTDALEGVQEGIQTQTGVISGALDQAISDIQTAIGEQTDALDESLSATAEGVEAIAEAVEDERINWRKFDLRGLFPFCIPFDIYNMLDALDAEPAAPHVQIPFVIQSIGFSYNIDLDFSAFNTVAAVMRQMELLCYGIALAWATSKVIKW